MIIIGVVYISVVIVLLLFYSPNYNIMTVCYLYPHNECFSFINDMNSKAITLGCL